MIQIKVDREAEKPLYAQIRDALSRAIEDQSLQPGDQLPTVAAFADQIGVTQCTVRRAYEDLTKTGVVKCQVGRGTFISEPEPEMGESPPSGKTARTRPGRPVLDEETKQAVRRVRMGMARGLDNLLSFHNRPGLIRFTSGVPGISTFRDGLLADMARDALKSGQDPFCFCYEPLGSLELREEIAVRLRKSGLEVTPEQVLITNGSQQAMTLTALNARERGRRVICETPCYTGIPNAFSALGHWVESVPRDREGPLPERLRRFDDQKSSLLYMVPEMHNPMGTDVSPERRRLIADWARDNQALIIEDRIFHDLRFEGRSPASFFLDAGPERTVWIGSFSKSFMPGLRIGWLVSERERVQSIAAIKKSMDLGCPSFIQGVALSLLRTGEYDRHAAQVREIYRRRRDRVLDALERYMPEGVSWTKPAGGFNMWVELPHGYSSIVLFLLAVERGTSFIPGPYMDIDHRFVNAFRLSYGDVEEDRIEEGIGRLGSAVADLLGERPMDAGLSGLGDFL